MSAAVNTRIHESYVEAQVEMGSERLRWRLERAAESVRATATEHGGLDVVCRREVCFLIVREAGRPKP